MKHVRGPSGLLRGRRTQGTKVKRKKGGKIASVVPFSKGQERGGIPASPKKEIHGKELFPAMAFKRERPPRLELLPFCFSRFNFAELFTCLVTFCLLSSCLRIPPYDHLKGSSS